MCPKRPAAQKWHAPTPALPPSRHQTALGQYIEKCPIPGWKATPLPTACHSGAEEIDRNTGNAQTPARPEWYDNARRDTQATRRPSQVPPHTRQATPDRPGTRDRRFTTHGTRRLSSEWEPPDPATRPTIRPGSPVTQARPNPVDPKTSSDPSAAGEPHLPLSENNWNVVSMLNTQWMTGGRLKSWQSRRWMQFSFLGDDIIPEWWVHTWVGTQLSDARHPEAGEQADRYVIWNYYFKNIYYQMQ